MLKVTLPEGLAAVTRRAMAGERGPATTAYLFTGSRNLGMKLDPVPNALHTAFTHLSDA